MRPASRLPTFGPDPRAKGQQEERRMIDLITKAYVLKNFAGDAIDFVKDRMEDMDVDIDAERWLHKVGLARHQPGKGAFGAFGVFVLGAAAGIIAGLAFAPRPGV